MDITLMRNSCYSKRDVFGQESFERSIFRKNENETNQVTSGNRQFFSTWIFISYVLISTFSVDPLNYLMVTRDFWFWNVSVLTMQVFFYAINHKSTAGYF